MVKEEAFISFTFSYEPLYQVLVESYFWSWLTNDINRFKQLLHADIVVEECSGDTYVGKDTCETWFKTWNKTGNKVMTWNITKTILESLNSEIIVEWQFACDYDFKAYSFDGCSVFEFRDHKIVSLKEFQMEKEKKYPYR